MTLLYTLGLLALIGIPVLILIYIIKNKYTEQTVTSTYLWTLSEKFIKRRIPINRLVGILSLILQILAVVLITLAIVHPILILPNSASAYCFVLDASGSMNIVQQGETRFEIGREKIKEIIEGAANGSTYTLIYVDGTPEMIYRDLSDKDRAVARLDALSVGYAEPEFLDILDAVQAYFDENRAAHTYLVTDTAYLETKNVTVLNVTDGYRRAENYAVSDITYETTGLEVIVSGKAISYDKDASITIEVFFETFGGSDGYVKYNEQNLSLVAGATTEFSIPCNLSDFMSLKVSIKEKDDLLLDSEIIVNNVYYENIANTLLVSDYPFLTQAALEAAGMGEVDVVKTEEYTANPIPGYGLYIFDSYSPAEIPQEGAVWFINPRSSLQGTNFAYRSDAEAGEAATFVQPTSTAAETLLAGVSMNDFELSRYVRCGIGTGFTTIASCEGSPIIFAGSNAYGNREAVFAFSFRDSAPFTLSTDCSTIVANLLSYSFPAIIEKSNFYCGEKLQVNVPAGTESIIITTPEGATAYLDTSVSISEYKLNEAGLYHIVLLMKNGGGERSFEVFASLPEAERVPFIEDSEFVLEGVALNDKFDGFYDNLLIIFIILAVVAVADYGVYCYEQYQLR